MSKLSGFWRDLRYGVRNLRKDLRFALLAVFALALGIGATVVIFSVVDSVMIDPLPYPNPDRRVVFYIHDQTKPDQKGRQGYTTEEFLAYRSQSNVFEDVLATIPTDFLYTNDQGTQQILGSRSTTNQLDIFGITPILGRRFTPADGQPGAPPVCIISYNFWTEQFNRDPKIVGRTITLNGIARTVVGVMPFGLIPLRNIFTPIGIGASELYSLEPLPTVPNFVVYGILKRGVTIEAANANLEVIARQLAKVYPKLCPKQFAVNVVRQVDYYVEPVQGILYALIAAVGLLLLIACSNVANLLLARATAREREIAIRATVGATRGRLVLQLLTESFLLAGAGCIAGFGLAYFGVKGAAAAIPPGVTPPETVIVMKPMALWFALGITFVTTLLCGLVPAVYSIGGDLHERLMGTGKGVNGGFAHGKLRSALVVMEVALSILLLIGAGLMARSLLAMQNIALGFNPSRVLFTRLVFPPGRFDTADQKRVFLEQVMARVQNLPGVISAAETVAPPPYAPIRGDVTVPGKTHSENWDAETEMVSEEYFQTLGFRLLEGRLLSDVDVKSARRVAVVNQTLARNFFGGENSLGRTIKFNAFDTMASTVKDLPHDSYFEIIGVVSDAKNRGLRDSPLPEAYVPYTITGWGTSRTLLVRTATDPNALLPTIQREVWSVDSNVAMALGQGGTGTIERLLEQYSYAAPRFGLVMLGSFAGIGLLLVIIGVFSVMAYSVSLQTHEIGIRMSLGAQRDDILRMVLKKGLLLIGAGVALGLLASFGLTRLLASQIWGISATDPWTFATVVAVVLAVGLAACYVPARRAMKVDPMVALRYE